jgi:hypothetical protein
VAHALTGLRLALALPFALAMADPAYSLLGWIWHVFRLSIFTHRERSVYSYYKEL